MAIEESTDNIKSRVRFLNDEGEKGWTRRLGFMARVKIKVINAVSGEGIRGSFGLEVRDGLMKGCKIGLCLNFMLCYD